MKAENIHYVKREETYHQGRVLHNLCGTDFMVLECFTDRNLLMINLRTGQFTVGLGVFTYSRYTKDGESGREIREDGIEWNNGVYLGYTPSEINFEELREKYGESRKKETVWQDEDGSYAVSVTETLEAIVRVKAEDVTDAVEKVTDMYYAQMVVLDADNLTDVSFRPAGFLREPGKEHCR